MDMYDDIPADGFEERLLTELKAVIATQAPRPSACPSAQPDPGGRGRLTGIRLSRRALAGIAAAAVVGGTLTGGLVERQLSGVAAAPAVSHASLDAFLNGAAAAALTSKTPIPPIYVDYFVERVVQYGPGQLLECQVAHAAHWRAGLLNLDYQPEWCPREVIYGHPLHTARAPLPEPNGKAKLVPPPPPVPSVTRPRWSDPAPFTPIPAGAKYHYAPTVTSLPRQPGALRAALYAAAGHGPRYWGMSSDDKDVIVFGLITRMLEARDYAPVWAALYRVLEDVPGVSFTPDTTDLVGEHGVGITFTEHGPYGLTNTSGFIMDASSYRFLGTTQAGYDWHVPGPPRYSSFTAVYFSTTGIASRHRGAAIPGH
jgi:hypothetical protein